MKYNIRDKNGKFTKEIWLPICDCPNFIPAYSLFKIDNGYARLVKVGFEGEYILCVFSKILNFKDINRYRDGVLIKEEYFNHIPCVKKSILEGHFPDILVLIKGSQFSYVKGFFERCSQ